MKRVVKCVLVIFNFCIGLGFLTSNIENVKGKNGWVDSHSPFGFYEKYIKRPLDFGLSLFALILLWPVMVATGVLVRMNLGKPEIFKQERPGLGGRIFTVRKFRTMSDEEGSDEERLTEFGKKLRGSSMDELPELTNILEGSMSIVGPRPQLARDMVFMSDRHRKRHDVRPGLTGLAQINGRNGITWEDKLDTDLRYIDHITFLGDVRIVFKTVGKVLRKDGINEDGQATAFDYGDWLLVNGHISQEEYAKKQREAEGILSGGTM